MIFLTDPTDKFCTENIVMLKRYINLDFIDENKIF